MTFMPRLFKVIYQAYTARDQTSHIPFSVTRVTDCIEATQPSNTLIIISTFLKRFYFLDRKFKQIHIKFNFFDHEVVLN